MQLKMTSRKSIILFLLVILIIGGGYYFYKKKFAGAQGMPPMPVEASPTRVTSINRSIEAVGILRANESVTIRSEIPGRVSEILFLEGQPVEKGKLLLTLEDSLQQANLKEAAADLKLSKAGYDRALTLLQKNVGSVSDRDTAFAKYQVNEASVSKAETTLAKMRITAPFSGILGLRKVSVGDFVNPGQDIVNLVDVSSMKVDFQIPEIYLKRIKDNQAVAITTNAYPDKNFTGSIYAIDPQIDPIGHSILIRASLPNNENLLKPGLFVSLKLIVEQLPEVILIPEQALMPQEDKQFVYKIQDGKAVLTEVTIGEREKSEVEITKGLTANDIVITAGQLKVQPDSPVAPINLKADKAPAP